MATVQSALCLLLPTYHPLHAFEPDVDAQEAATTATVCRIKRPRKDAVEGLLAAAATVIRGREPIRGTLRWRRHRQVSAGAQAVWMVSSEVAGTRASRPATSALRDAKVAAGLPATALPLRFDCLYASMACTPSSDASLCVRSVAQSMTIHIHWQSAFEKVNCAGCYRVFFLAKDDVVAVQLCRPIPDRIYNFREHMQHEKAFPDALQCERQFGQLRRVESRKDQVSVVTQTVCKAEDKQHRLGSRLGSDASGRRACVHLCVP